VPIGVAVEGANCHDMKLVRPTIDEIITERPAPTEEQPQGMCLDKGYDYDDVRATLKEFGFTADIRAWGGSPGAQNGGGISGTPVGGRTRAFVDESLSSPPGPLG
jgi:hypothetical protein